MLLRHLVHTRNEQLVGVITMRESTKRRLKIMIIEDEEDILILYNDYLSHRGHQVINRYLNAELIISELEKEAADVYLIDYRLPGNKNGIDLANEILTKFPSSSILFITAYEPLCQEITKNPLFYNKNVDILLKPVKLDEIESSMLNLMNKK
jgi:DNA-binding NtrC family response regulator